MALFSTAGMVPLYSGVTARTASAPPTSVAERVGGGRHRLGVDVLVVEGQLVQAVGDLEDDTVRCLVAQRLGDAAVEGVGAEAADQGDDAGGIGHGRLKRTAVRFYSGGYSVRTSRQDVPVMDLLPLADGPAPERSDAARNREALLRAAQELIDECGNDGVTMDAVAARAGVGKGTVFRRFESREGLMAALLNRSETEWQAR